MLAPFAERDSSRRHRKPCAVVLASVPVRSLALRRVLLALRRLVHWRLFCKCRNHHCHRSRRRHVGGEMAHRWCLRDQIHHVPHRLRSRRLIHHQSRHRSLACQRPETAAELTEAKWQRLPDRLRRSCTGEGSISLRQ